MPNVVCFMLRTFYAPAMRPSIIFLRTTSVADPSGKGVSVTDDAMGNVGDLPQAGHGHFSAGAGSAVGRHYAD
jgi:hypothetical protein